MRLKSALQPVYDLLTEDEKKRNSRGDDRLYVRNSHKGFALLNSIYTDQVIKDDEEMQLDGTLFEGMGGRVLYSERNTEQDG